MSVPPYLAAPRPPRVQPAAPQNAVLILALVVGGILLVGGLCIVVVLYVMLTPVVNEARAVAKKTEAENSARDLGQLLLNYQMRNGRFPAAQIRAGSGPQSQVVFSWRAELLPFTPHRDLFDQLQMDKPWDDPVNLPHTSRPIDVFSSPLCPDSLQTQRTAFVAVLGSETVIRAGRSATMRDIYDGVSNTAMLLELRQSDIAWAEPRDVTLDQAIQLIQNSTDPKGLTVVMADGSVRAIPPTTSTRAIIKLFNCSDGIPN